MIIKGLDSVTKSVTRGEKACFCHNLVTSSHNLVTTCHNVLSHLLQVIIN